MPRVRWIFTYLIFFLILSCSDEVNPLVNTGEEYYFFTIEEGSLITGGEDIPVSLSETHDEADSVFIRLKDSDFNELALVRVDPVELRGDGLPVSLPEDLEEGIYYLNFEAWKSDVLLSESELYFYVVSGDYAISGIETYPPNIVAGESISARAYLTYPEGSDPWIRWYLNSRVIQEGLLSDDNIYCNFIVPEEEGVFSLMGEIFPVEPVSDQRSSAVFHTDLFITPGDENPWSLLDESVHTFYVSFVSAITGTAGSPELIGKPALKSGKAGGYILSSSDGIRYHYNTLPLDSLGNVEDFTLSLDFEYEDLPAKDEWRMVTIGNSLSSFVLFYNGSDGAFYAGFSGRDNSFSSLPGDLLPRDGQVSLDLVYTIENGVGRLLWFVQNEILHESFVSLSVQSPDGDTVIGADETHQGLPLLWLSVGVSESVQETETPDVQEQLGEILEPELLYLRGESVPDIISIEKIPLSRGFLHT